MQTVTAKKGVIEEVQAIGAGNDNKSAGCSIADTGPCVHISMSRGDVYANSEGHLMKCSKAFSSRELLNEGSGS